MKREIQEALEAIFERNKDVLADDFIIINKGKMEAILKQSEAYTDSDIERFLNKLFSIEYEEHKEHVTFWRKFKKELENDNLDLSGIVFKLDFKSSLVSCVEYSTYKVEIDDIESFMDRQLSNIKCSLESEIDCAKDEFLSDLKKAIEKEIEAFEV